MAKRIGTAAAVSEASKYIPVAGQIVAAAVSAAAVRLVLMMYIDDCYKIAEEMLNAHFQQA